jgi:DNA helicase-2/ATP-dependent DNA helicase PcrA
MSIPRMDMIEITDEDIDQIQVELDLIFDEPRREALKSFDDVQACPGSGKTTMVAAKLLLIAKKWASVYQGVCVLTHTNVAKNEIVTRLKTSECGYKLLSYPHFIGTIQEFVNKFMSIPLLRSEGIQVNQIDDELCCAFADRWLRPSTRNYLTGKHIDSLQKLQYAFVNNELKLNVPGFNGVSTSGSYVNLTNIKSRLIQKGYHFYHEMYEFSEALLASNSGLTASICNRFPLVLVDEMQDTQKFQDELLNKIFDGNVFYQRFGDPDQAIYGEAQSANESYNNRNLEKVVSTHRFNTSIASIAKNLSLNRIQLISEVVSKEEHTNTIFLVDDECRTSVFDAFAKLCTEEVPDDSDLPIKAIGAVGKHKDDSLTICDYYPDYNRATSTTNFRPDTLIQYFYRAKELADEKNANSYSLLLDAVVRCGQIADLEFTYLGGEIVKCSKPSMRRYLRECNKAVEFNSRLNILLLNDISEHVWIDNVSQILSFIGLDINEATIQNFIGFAQNNSPEEQSSTNNDVVVELDGARVVIEVTTIHSVKGETHAATLVLENKFHNFDAGHLIDYILGEEELPPTAARKVKFMKQFYVGFTRPKYLVCLAMDKSRFPEEHIDKVEVGGWRISDLTGQGEVFLQ